MLDLSPWRRDGELKTPRIWHDMGENGTQEALGQWTPVGLLDMGTRMIHEMHVMNARRAGSHASKAGEAAVDVRCHFRRRRPVVLKHVLDEVDASARRIELVAVEHIGRAGRGAEAAMNAGAEDFFRFRHGRIGKLRQGKGCLHARRPPTYGRR